MENKDLLLEAVKAQKNSYSPYSKYAVGAAIETTDGKIFYGCNIENSAFGVSNCAERTALFSAIANGYKSFKKIAIVGGDNSKLTFPCGVCRQALNEFCPKIEVVLGTIVDSKIKIKTFKLNELLPYAFGPDSLE